MITEKRRRPWAFLEPKFMGKMFSKGVNKFSRGVRRANNFLGNINSLTKSVGAVANDFRNTDSGKMLGRQLESARKIPSFARGYDRMSKIADGYNKGMATTQQLLKDTENVTNRIQS